MCITRCSNNYGPYQHPRSYTAYGSTTSSRANPLPVYGRGLNVVRDWIHADDHARGILAVAHAGRVGGVYNFGGYNERRNIDIVKLLISTVAAEVADNKGIDESLITYVNDRPGHDRRYAIDAAKSMDELGWTPLIPFDKGASPTRCAGISPTGNGSTTL